MQLLGDSIPDARAGRMLYVATLVNSIGTGMFLTTSALFFTRYVGLTATQVGLGLTVGALVGLIAGVPVGGLADRHAARNVYICTLTAETVAMASYILVRGFWEFAAAAALVSTAASASYAARAPVIRSMGGDRPTVLRAQIKSAMNIGIAVGGLCSGVALAMNTKDGYLVLTLVNAATFEICAALVMRLPRAPRGIKAKTVKTRDVLRDRPYIMLTLINLMLMLQYPVLMLILPLWAFGHTNVPHWLVAAAIPINTAMVAALQVRLSRGITGSRSAARVMVRASIAILLSLMLMGSLNQDLKWGDAGLLIVAVIIYTLGEIWFSAASYELSFNLAPAGSTGSYQGLYGVGGGVGMAISTAVGGYLCLVWGWPGWVTLGLLMVSAALLTPSVVRRAESDRNLSRSQL
jgi:MFS family permease